MITNWSYWNSGGRPSFEKQYWLAKSGQSLFYKNKNIVWILWYYFSLRYVHVVSTSFGMDYRFQYPRSNWTKASSHCFEIKLLYIKCIYVYAGFSTIIALIFIPEIFDLPYPELLPISTLSRIFFFLLEISFFLISLCSTIFSSVLFRCFSFSVLGSEYKTTLTITFKRKYPYNWFVESSRKVEDIKHH